MWGCCKSCFGQPDSILQAAVAFGRFQTRGEFEHICILEYLLGHKVEDLLGQHERGCGVEESAGDQVSVTW